MRTWGQVKKLFAQPGKAHVKGIKEKKNGRISIFHKGSAIVGYM
jgi:hypothetical protein